MQDVNRITPALPVGAMQTYAIGSPIATHWRPATCAEVSCRAYVEGFSITIDPNTDLGKAQLAYVRSDLSRPRPAREFVGELIRFTYPPGTKPFASPEHDSHVLPLDRPEVFLRVPGDWRGATGPTLVYDRPDQWVDDFATNADRIKTAIERG